MNANTKGTGVSAPRMYTQVLIIGSGLAGCATALSLADAGHDVVLLGSAETLGGGNSELAQGGIIYEAPNTAGHAPNPDARALERDILVAGHRHNYTAAVRHLCRHGPRIVDRLLLERARVPFDTGKDGAWDLTREGGHSVPRILHVADYTGRAIMEHLTAVVRAHPRITCLCNKRAVDILTSRHQGGKSQYRYHVKNRCMGAYVLDSDTLEISTILADWTVLATGGVGQVFLHSTNSPCCVGSGVSIAYRAGVALANLEFMQFHPTALYSEFSHRRPLITEAMRGEGARLLNGRGEAFMPRYDRRADLAPRDIVAQSMMEEMLHNGEHYLYLDASRVEQDLPTRFPTVFQQCREVGIDIRKEPIPVVPAAHYFCGGILTDTHGRTDLDGLYAIGECACTGLHGANRLASTSLLEAVTWGWFAAQDIHRRCATSAGLPARLRQAIPDWEPLGDDTNDDPALIKQDWTSIRSTMWNYVGISRSTARLRRAFEDLRILTRRIHDFYRRTRLSPRLVDLYHGVQVAYIITQAAMRNHSSLGCHFRKD